MLRNYLQVLIFLSLFMSYGCGNSGSDNTVETSMFTVGGQISGLSNKVVLTNNASDLKVFTRDGFFSFSTAVPDGESYDVTVNEQPEGQICVVENGSGTVVGGDISDVQVDCHTMPDIDMVSVSSSGIQGAGTSYDAAINSDGRYVAFASYSSSLIEGDNNASSDIFVHDRVTGETKIASVTSEGILGNDNSYNPSLNDDGRYLAFGSDASNLVVGDSNGTMDIFFHDRQTGQTSLISVATDGTHGNGFSLAPLISSNGRYVVFASDADNLVDGDTNGARDVFVHDRITRETTRVSVASDGEEGNDDSTHVTSLSKDGRYIAFQSDSSNLVDGDMNGALDAFVHDRKTGETTLVSVANDGTQGNNDSVSGSLSSDGRYVTFYSFADNLLLEDTNNTWDVFIRDRVAGNTEIVSMASDGIQGNDESWGSSMSADGRFVVFTSLASNLVNGDTNNAFDIFVRDRILGNTDRVSISIENSEGNGDSMFPSISADGGFIAFSSLADDLVSEDMDVGHDVFVRKN